MTLLDRRQLLFSLATASAAFSIGGSAFASAASSPKDIVLAARDSVGRVIHSYGDSISRGYGTGQFSDLMRGDEPLFPVSCIWAIINQVLGQNEKLVFDGLASGKSWSARDISAFVVPLGGVPDMAALIASRVEANIIRAGDVVVLEDAGDHSRDPSSYQAKWEAMRFAASGRLDVTVIMMSMFDYISPDNKHLMPDFQYDVAMSDGRTMNDATRAAAASELGCVGRTILIDMNAIMDAEVAATRPGHDVPFMHSDGIHPNVWGEMLMAGEIMKASGLQPSIGALAALKRIARENHHALSFGITGFSPYDAQARVEHCLVR